MPIFLQIRKALSEPYLHSATVPFMFSQAPGPTHAGLDGISVSPFPSGGSIYNSKEGRF